MSARPDLGGKKKRRPGDAPRAASASAGGASASVPREAEAWSRRAPEFTSELVEPTPDVDPRDLFRSLVDEIEQETQERLRTEGEFLDRHEKAALVKSGATFLVDRIEVVSRRSANTRRTQWEARCLMPDGTLGLIGLLTGNEKRDRYMLALAGTLPRRFRLVDQPTLGRSLRLLEPVD